ncbi:hypothetical protein [Nocardia sp. NPDC051833]|uniref:hypothetical protein n=1 Tax=Nocardia sp. NPDC051833 TaxID=3155674 RepID=UPI003441FD26
MSPPVGADNASARVCARAAATESKWTYGPVPAGSKVNGRLVLDTVVGTVHMVVKPANRPVPDGVRQPDDLSRPAAGGMVTGLQEQHLGTGEFIEQVIDRIDRKQAVLPIVCQEDRGSVRVELRNRVREQSGPGQGLEGFPVSAQDGVGTDQIGCGELAHRKSLRSAGGKDSVPAQQSVADRFWFRKGQINHLQSARLSAPLAQPGSRHPGTTNNQS